MDMTAVGAMYPVIPTEGCVQSEVKILAALSAMKFKF
jgi:hypothetical protein